MGNTRRKEPATKRTAQRPTTPQELEDHLIMKSMKLVEKRIDEGVASSQEVTHFLKLGSSRGRLEAEGLEANNVVLKAKAIALESEAHIAELITNALDAMRVYKGVSEVEEAYDED